MKTTKQFSCLERAVIAFMIANCVASPVMAGTQGAFMNSIGYGKAVDSISFGGVVSRATSPNMTGPCASVNPQPGFPACATASLPPGTPASVFCQSKGFPNYVWSIQASVTGGASADNSDLQSILHVVTNAPCASITLDTTNTFVDDFSGQITVNALATAGTGFRLLGFEYLPGAGGQQPSDLDDLKTNGLLRLNFTLPGPFNFTTNNCTALQLPYTTTTGHTNFYLVVDTLALSAPFLVTCPNNLLFECDQQVTYPLPTVSGGCGQVYASYSPPASSLTLGTTPVTVTVFDLNGNTNTCTFNVTIEDTNAPVILGCPGTITAYTGPGRTTCNQVVTWTPPTASDNCGVVSFTSTYAPGSTFPVGTTPVTYTARDAAGNTTQCSFNVTVVDNTKPVITGCPANITVYTGPGRTTCDQVATWTPPTASDNCSLASFTSTHLPGATFPVGTTTVTYTAIDAATPPNTNTCSFTVTVVDNTPPKLPVLATLTGQCGASVTFPVPTTTDNCGGPVTVSPSAAQVRSTPGTNVVQWTFTDAAGNSSTAYQTGIVASLIFQGFLSPIGTASNTCATAVRVNEGSTVPIKFDMFCGTSEITGGQPPIIAIQKLKNCAPDGTPEIGTAQYLSGQFKNYWHYNWKIDRCRSGEAYKITVTLPDGTTRYVFVKFKKQYEYD